MKNIGEGPRSPLQWRHSESLTAESNPHFHFPFGTVYLSLPWNFRVFRTPSIFWSKRHLLPRLRTRTHPNNCRARSSPSLASLGAASIRDRSATLLRCLVLPGARMLRRPARFATVG